MSKHLTTDIGLNELSYWQKNEIIFFFSRLNATRLNNMILGLELAETNLVKLNSFAGYDEDNEDSEQSQAALNAHYEIRQNLLSLASIRSLLQLLHNIKQRRFD